MRRLPPVLILASLIALALLTSAGASSSAVPAQLSADSARPGQPLHVTGRVLDDAAAVKLQVQAPDGALRGPYGPYAVTGGRPDPAPPARATPRPGAARISQPRPRPRP